MKMTYNQAMLIQRAQMSWYRRNIGMAGVKAIRAKTKPCPGNPDAMMPVHDINALVPRGGNFEWLIKNVPKDPDPTRMAMHDAIKRGLL